MSAADQERIARLIESLPEDRTFDPAELDRRMKEMDEGKFVTLEQVRARHERLKGEAR